MIIATLTFWHIKLFFIRYAFQAYSQHLNDNNILSVVIKSTKSAEHETIEDANFLPRQKEEDTSEIS
jgi:hypothetical protein